MERLEAIEQVTDDSVRVVRPFESLLEPVEGWFRKVDRRPRAAVADQPIERIGHIVDPVGKRGHVPIAKDPPNVRRPVELLLQGGQPFASRSGHGGAQPNPGRQFLVSIHLAGDELDQRIASETRQEQFDRVDGGS